MKTKERIVNEIEKLTEDTLGVILKFILSLEKGSVEAQTAQKTSWGILALESGSFDFWLDPGETEYTTDDLKERR